MSPDPCPTPHGPGVRTLSSHLQAAEGTYRELLFGTFAFELRLGHRLGFVRAFASPEIAELLASTGEIERDPGRRGTDTGLFLYSMLYHGLDSAIGRRAVERLNHLHAAWPIRNEDYVWVLGNWFLPGLELVDRHGWRPLAEAERQAVVDWHRELGLRLGVRNIPASAAEFETVSRDYERRNLGSSPAARALRSAVLEVAARSAPRPLRPWVGEVGAALLDEPTREALELPAPGVLARALVPAALTVRAARRRRRGPGRPWFVPDAPRRDYPDGYTVEDLGPAGSADCPPRRRPLRRMPGDS